MSLLPLFRFPGLVVLARSPKFWFLCSILFAVYYGGCGLLQAFSSTYVVQDDAREYVFWMQRFIEPDLFTNDLIADYFQSITPLGYATLYQIMAAIGITPLLLSKILPICLGILTTIYTFWLSLRIFPLPITAFISTLILNQSIWFSTDVASATPRSFVYPLLPAFLYYFLQNSRLAITIIMILQALFYPLLIFLYTGILIIHWRKHLFPLILILGLTAIVMSPYIISASQYGPIVSWHQALQMPEHWLGGRHPFFDANVFRFWLMGQHSGILPGVMPPLIWISLLLPFCQRKTFLFPEIRYLKDADTQILVTMIGIAIALYFAAHLFFLKLFFPTRHTIHLFRVIMAITAAIVLTVLGKFALSKYQNLPKLHWHKIPLFLLLLTFSLTLLFYPNFLKTYPKAEYKIGRHPQLYQFLQQQPTKTLTASLSDEADNLPTFSHRPILTSREYALPFHLGYYQQIRQRTSDLITAQYHPTLQPAQNLIKKYQIDYWLIEKNSFQPEYLTQRTWLNSFQPAFNQAINYLQTQQQPAITSQIEQCTVWQNQTFWLLKTACMINAS